MKYFEQFEFFHDQAMRIAGLNDFGSHDYVEPMRMLLSDYDNYGRFSVVGQQLTNGAMVGLLIARLMTQQGLKENPSLLDAPIEKPLIILGMPRTGSTSLHRLIAKDPDTQCMVPWLGNAPMPRPPRETWETNRWYQMTQQGLDAFWKVFPAVKSMHPVFVDEPDECRFGLEPSFWSPPLAITGPMQGDYAEWVASTVPNSAYRHYRSVLALISGGDRRRWILKDPTTHSWAPKTLLNTFPDACIVYTHREPAQAMASVLDMVYQLRRERMSHVGVEEHGRELLDFWAPAIEQLDFELRQLDDSRLIDIHINELQENPISTAERIYRHFGFRVTDAARSAWQHHAESDPRSGHGQHHYQIDRVGLRPQDIFDSVPGYYANYRSRYGTAP